MSKRLRRVKGYIPWAALYLAAYGRRVAVHDGNLAACTVHPRRWAW